MNRFGLIITSESDGEKSSTYVSLLSPSVGNLSCEVPVLCSPAVAAMPVRRCAPAARGTIQRREGICAPRCQC